MGKYDGQGDAKESLSMPRCRNECKHHIIGLASCFVTTKGAPSKSGTVTVQSLSGFVVIGGVGTAQSLSIPRSHSTAKNVYAPPDRVVAPCAL